MYVYIYVCTNYTPYYNHMESFDAVCVIMALSLASYYFPHAVIYQYMVFFILGCIPVISGLLFCLSFTLLSLGKPLYKRYFLLIEKLEFASMQAINPVRTRCLYAYVFT